MQKARRHIQTYAPTACRRMVSGSLSPSCSECFSPFPHGTRPLSVSREYLALPDGPGGFAQDFTCPALLRVPLCPEALRVRGCHPLWPDFPDRSARATRYNRAALLPRDGLGPPRFGLLPVRSPLLGESLLFSLPAGTKMFQFPALASRHRRDGTIKGAGLSHSGIRGSQAVCATRGFSQLTTPFVASVSLGIHHAPLLAFPYIDGFPSLRAPGQDPVRAVSLVPTCQRTDAAEPRAFARRGQGGE